MTGTIDAKEGRDTVTMDLSGAYIWAYQDELLHMCLRGKLAELLVLTAPEIYSPYIRIGTDGKPILYVKLLKTLYGCIISALLFYRRLVKDLLAMEFKLNPHDHYVANMMVKGTQ